MHNIQKVSSFITLILNLMLIIIPLVIIAQWSLIDWEPFRKLIAPSQSIVFEPITTPEGVVNFIDLKLTPLSRCIGVLGTVISQLPFFVGILILKNLFQNYKKGQIFSLQNAKDYQYLGGLFFLYGILAKPIGEMLMILTATLSNPPGHRYISLAFGTPNLEVLFCGLLIVVISWVMIEAYKLQDDQKLTI